METCHRWLPFSLSKSHVAPFFVVTWPLNLIISDTIKRISGPDSDEKLAPNIIDKYSPMKNIMSSSSAGVGEKDKKPLVVCVLVVSSTVRGSGKGSDILTV